MVGVNVTINMSARQLGDSYAYSVPPAMLENAHLGKRVLVDFGGRKVEGYIVSQPQPVESGTLKPLLKILDEETCFDEKMLQLAQWMADSYCCPLAKALNLMVPRGLHRIKGRSLCAAIDRDSFEQLLGQGIELNRQLFQELWEQGELTLEQVQDWASPAEIQCYLEQGYMVQAGIYKTSRVVKDGCVYALGALPADLDLEVMTRRAPRQAEIIRLLTSTAQVPAQELEAVSAAHARRALLDKGYIVVRAEKWVRTGTEPVLSAEQELAVNLIRDALAARQEAEFLLQGVTGSGKTEVYLRAAELALSSGRGAIILVPEIALTRQLVEVFAARMPGLAVLHSAMSGGERYAQWKRIKQGEARLVLGARSAVFAPVNDLGLIIMDEEQEGTFKQEESPRYHTREVARHRACLDSAVFLAGSATPAIETYYRTMTGESKLLVLQERAGGGRLPAVVLEDMRSLAGASRRVISPLLQEKMTANLEREEQVILFINRRGYAPNIICMECGQVETCPTCSVAMTYHQDLDGNLCHYCGRHQKYQALCHHCGSRYVQMSGTGTQRVEEEVRHLFPQARVERLDLDSSRRRGSQESLLARMKAREIDVLVGTQMVAKGLDFPGVSLVGVVDADAILNLPDFRSGERCFQLLVQAAGRAGRGDVPGEVVIQTYNPDHPIIKLATAQDYLGFFRYELQVRRLLDYPPFSHLLRLIFSSASADDAWQSARTLAGNIEDLIDASEEEVTIMGPAPCPIHKIRNRFRHQLLLKCRSLELLRSIARHIVSQAVPKHVKMDLDLNPITTL